MARAEQRLVLLIVFIRPLSLYVILDTAFAGVSLCFLCVVLCPSHRTYLCMTFDRVREEHHVATAARATSCPAAHQSNPEGGGGGKV